MFFSGADGVVFVVDSSDRQRVAEAREELLGILTDEVMTPGVPTMVLANKQDLPNAVKSLELVEMMGLVLWLLVI